MTCAVYQRMTIPDLRGEASWDGKCVAQAEPATMVFAFEKIEAVHKQYPNPALEENARLQEIRNSNILAYKQASFHLSCNKLHPSAGYQMKC